jgi:very-short-patch-repair endonuclease
MTKKIPTPHTLLLADALRSRGIYLELEHWDGHKHVDIYIPQDNLYIEVDGVPHYTHVDKMISDFNRDYFSFKSGYFTKHITNEALETHLEAIANAIAKVAENAPNAIGEKLHLKRHL